MGDWQSVVHGSYEGLNDLFKVMLFLQNDEFQMEECLEKLWNSSFFSFFLEVRPGLGLQHVLKEDFGFVSCVPSTISSFFKEVFLVQNETKGKKRVFRRHLGKSHSIGYHGTRQFIEIQFILEGLF